MVKKPSRPTKKQEQVKDENLCSECKKSYDFPLTEEELLCCNQCLKRIYRGQLPIDRNLLEEHTEEHHMRLEKWGTSLVEMKDIYYGITGQIKELDEEMKSKRAELDGRIRTCASEKLEEEFGIPKITEGAVTGAIERHKEVRELLDKKRGLLKHQAEAAKRRDILVSAVEGFRERGAMIKVCKDLYCAQYYDRTHYAKGKRDEGKIAETVRVPKK